MTEVERIMNKGAFPEDFLKEEIRCDFQINENQKKVWLIELDLLMEFDRVCKKHGLKYYAVYGTLLGAIRHNGFIPWDDDMDICMPRDDYEKFLKLSDEFEEPYFLQEPHTDPGYYYSMAKLRNSRTTGFSDIRGCFGFNSGLWIDINPIDYVNLEDCENLFNEIDKLNAFCSAYMKIPGKHLNDKGKRLLRSHPYLSPMQACDDVQNKAAYLRGKKTDFLALAANTVYNITRTTYRAEDFEETVMWDFEGVMKLPVPKGYDNVLKVTYRDYMKFPPVEDRGLWHSNVMDAERPYTDYFKEYGVIDYNVTT